MGYKKSYQKPLFSYSDSSSSSESDTSTIYNVAPVGENYKKIDITAEVVGDFGIWQFWISLLMALMKLSNAWYQLNIIFMAPLQEFWCAKPEIFKGISDEEWKKISNPIVEEEPCFIYDPDLLAMKPDIDRRLIPLVPCPKFVYDTKNFNRTIVSDWDLVCDKRWLVHVTQCVMMTGILLGGILFGVLADSYGRKKPLMWSIVVQAGASFIAGASTWYWWFLFNWFILALACGGVTIISFVICLEVVSGKWRTIMPVLYQAPFGLGNTVMALLAYYFRDWRKIEFGLASLSSLYILYWFWIPESPRWLLAHGQPAQAVEVLYKAAQKNKRHQWTRERIQSLIPNMEQRIQEPPAFTAFMKSKNMRQKTVLLSLNWLITGLAFYTFSQYLGGIGGNVFRVIAATGIISVFGPIVCVAIVLFTGRRQTIWLFQIISGLCFFVIIFIPRSEDADAVRIFFAGIGFAAMAAYVPTLYLFSGELYPTLGRNKLVGFVTMFARFGSMVAPFIVALDSYLRDLPLILLVVLSIGQLWLLVPLPETKDCQLPNTMQEAEMLGKPQIVNFYTNKKVMVTGNESELMSEDSERNTYSPRRHS